MEIPRVGIEEADWDKGIDKLVQSHPEIEKFQIGNKGIGIYISDAGLQCLLSLPNLLSLKLCRTMITGERLSVGRFSQIVTLILTYCPLSDLGLVNILTVCGRELECLDISNSAITGEIDGLRPSSFGLPNLKMLCCQDCSNLMDSGLMQLLRLCENSIGSLSIGGTSVSGEGLINLPALPHLEYLNCHSAKKLSDSGLVQLLRIGGKTLTGLNLRSTNISGESLKEVDQLALVDLDYSYCSHLSDLGRSICNFVFL